MTHTLTIHDRQEIEGERRGVGSLELQREAATLALQNRPGFDIAAISEEEFEAGLQRLELRQKRMQRILDTVLHDGVHYGNPKGPKGYPVFKKPMLYQSGVEELIQLFRLTPRHASAPIIIGTESFVSVSVTIDIYDSAGRLLASRSGGCNTMEKRFERRDGKGYTYRDAREVIHDCLAMAEKRALKLAVSAATGATAFFAAEEEMEKALTEDEPEPEPQPGKWTKDEIDMVVKKAARKGLKTRDELYAFIEDTLGTRFVGTGADVQKVLDALDRYKRGPTPVPEASYDAAPAATPEPEPGDADEGELAL